MSVAQAHLSTLQALRATIRTLEGEGVAPTQGVATGSAALDRVSGGGWPQGALSEVVGPVGGGSTRLLLNTVAHHTARAEQVIWVDTPGAFYPPMAAQLGVDLQGLVLLRPTADRVPWVVEQVAASGAVPLVIVAHPPEIPGAAERWLHAARRGQCALILQSPKPLRTLRPALRVRVRSGRVMATRRQGGGGAQEWALEPWPEPVAPWP